MAERDTTGSVAGTSDAGRLKARVSWMVREHPGLVVTAAYFAASAIGMLSSVSFYSYFGVNVFHFAQLSDFVIVAVRNPIATLAILLAFPAVWFIIVTDDWLDRRIRWYRYLYGPAWLRRLSRSPAALFLYFLIYAWTFSYLYASRLHDAVRDGRWPVVEVQLHGGTYLGRDATRPFDATLLGATSTHVFLFDASSDRATIVPTESLLSMQVR